MGQPKVDIAVIGAGISGIAFARFYLDIHPDSKIKILETDTCVGGVWSSARLYQGFWSQGGRRMSGYSDSPIRLPSDAETFHDLFEAKYVTEYLEEYVDGHVYNGTSIRDRIVFGAEVQDVKKVGGLWRLVASRKQEEDQITVEADRLVVASGNTSSPNMPYLPSGSIFQGLILHQKDFGRAIGSIDTSTPYQSATVLGGGKSAADMVYGLVKAGKTVSWIIRESGEGPAAFSAAAGKGPYKNGPEIAATRIISALSPSCFSPVTWWTRMIHGTAYGRDTITKIWLGADQACRDLVKIQDKEGALPGFKNISSSSSIFWCTGPLGMIQREDFWETIARNVAIYRSDITSMEEHSILLNNGKHVPTDVLFCGTGWNHHYDFLAKELVVLLGLPHHPREDGERDSKKWSSLLHDADQDVLQQFPQLENPPQDFQRPAETTTSRLYNCIAPLNDATIVFVGHIQLSNAFRMAEAQAVWATAYFDGLVKLPIREQAEREIAYMNAFSKRRYPSHGAKGNYFHFDLVSYTDKLMNDIGITSHRKGWWWQDLAGPCLASDFKDAKDEYLMKLRSRINA